MKKKQLLLGTALLCIASLAFADSAITIPVPNDGLVGPKGGELKMAGSGYLIPGVDYTVSCHVSNPNFPEGIIVALTTPMDIAGYASAGHTITINGKQVGMNNVQTTLTKQDNVVSFTRISDTRVNNGPDSTSQFAFKNIDSGNTITVSNCTATPSAS